MDGQWMVNGWSMDGQSGGQFNSQLGGQYDGHFNSQLMVALMANLVVI